MEKYNQLKDRKCGIILELFKLKNSNYCVCTIYTYVEFILSNIINNLSKKGDIISNRDSNLKDFKYEDQDLNNILIYNDIINNVDNLVDSIMDQEIIEKNNINTIDNLLLDADTKIYNKCKKNQKLFKDAKTIAARFNKNSLLKNYNTEINYYENLRTPWWSEN